MKEFRGSIIKRPCIETFTGKEFNLMNPTLESIDIRDIAHGLSNICRYTGQTRYHYSVAQHSILVSGFAHTMNAFAALLHDAAEAYTSDIPTPLKDLVPGFYDIEERIQSLVYAKFDVKFIDFSELKILDCQIMTTEVKELMPNKIWGEFPYNAMPVDILPLTPKKVEGMFLRTFYRLAAGI